jgi:hypothetical protein
VFMWTHFVGIFFTLMSGSRMEESFILFCSGGHIRCSELPNWM